MSLRRSPFVLLAVLVATAAVAAVYLRRPPAQPNVEESVPAPLPVAEEPGPPPDFRPAHPEEARAAVQRVLGDVIPLETVRAHAALVGDFNGDDSPDLLVPLRPLEEKLAALNDLELANWIVQDASVPALELEADPSPKPALVDKGDLLLAILHGYGSAGWRSPEARQVYLLKVARHSELSVIKRDEVKAQAAERKQRWPYLRGDLVRELGHDRFLYWTGGRYVWHDPAAAKLAQAPAPPKEKAKAKP
jgi:hypothetical protein